MSQVTALELANRVVGGARGQGHVGERWIDARRAGHAGAVGDEQVRHVVRLVVRVEHRRLWITAHACRPHLVHAEAGRPVVIVRLDAPAPRGLEHLRRLTLHVLADRPLVLAPRAVDAQQWDPPLVLPLRVQVHVVLVARQALAVSLQRHPPRSRLAQALLQVRAQARLRRAAAPSLTTRSRLDPIASEEADLLLSVRAEVAEPRDVGPRGPPAVDVLVLETGDDSFRAGLGDVVHQVVTQLPARVGEPGREARALRVQEDLGRGERRGAEEDESPGVLARLLGMCVDDTHARGPVPPFVVHHALYDRIGHDRQPPRLPRRRQRRAQAREVPREAAAARALVARSARAPAVVGPRQVRDPHQRQAASGKLALDRLLHALLRTRHLPGREKLAVRQVRQAQPLPAHPDEALDVAVPGREIPVANRPIHAVAVAQVGLEVEVAPSPAQPPPDETAPAQLVAADPAERFVVGRNVRMLPVIDEEVPRGLPERVILALDRIIALVELLLAEATVRELPGLPPLRHVVLAVLHVAAALEHEGPQPLLAELLGGPAPGDAGAHDDGVVRLVHTAHVRPISARGTHP